MAGPTHLTEARSPLRSVGVALALAGLLVVGSVSGPSPTVAVALGSTPTLGTVTPIAALPKDCPIGSVCAGYRVVCPGVSQSATAFTATRMPIGLPRGMALFFSGDIGHRWWALEPGSTAFLGRLRNAGFATVEVRWPAGWSVAALGEDAGTGRLACRPASLIKWIHDHRFVPLGVPVRPVGECGFCVTGNSGGASQVSYALSFYGLETVLDGVFPTSGPPHAAQDKGCLRRPGEGLYYYGGNAAIIDRAHGFMTDGPCQRQDASFLSRWLAESVDTGGRDFFHPATRLHFIHSDFDVPSTPHGLDYIARLRSAGTPLFREQVIVGMPHRLQSSTAGLDALFNAFVAATRAK